MGAHHRRRGGLGSAMLVAVAAGLAAAGCRRPPAHGPTAPAPDMGRDAPATDEALGPLSRLGLRFDRSAGLIHGRWVGDATGLAVELASLDLPAASGDGDASAGAHASMAAPAAGEAEAITLTASRAAGPDDAFVLRLPPGQPLTGGRALTLTLETAQGRLDLRRKVPYVRASLHPGDVVGAGMPHAPVTVELRLPSGALRARGLARADAQGDFMAWPRDERGERVRPAAGDRVVVNAGDGPWSIDLPALEGGPLDRQHLGGSGPSGGRIDLTLWNPWLPGRYEGTGAEAGADGRWSGAVEVPLIPSTHFYMTALLPDGDQAFHCQQLPRLHVEPGSAVVRVDALSDLDARLALLRGPAGRESEAASASGREAWSGELALTLRDGRGDPVTVVAGDRLRGRVNGAAIDLVVPPLEASLDGSGRVTGRAEPGAEVGLAMPGPLDGATARADGEGRFAIALDPDRFPEGGPRLGQELIVYALLPGDHNLERRFPGGQLLLDLAGLEVRGQAGAGSSVSLVDGGGELGMAADAAGDFLLSAPRLDRPGAALRVALGGADLDLTVPELTLDYDRATGVARGSAPAGAALELRVIQGARSPGESLSVIAGADGRWALDLTGEPGRGHRHLPASVRRLELRWTERQGLVWQRAWSR